MISYVPRNFIEEARRRLNALGDTPTRADLVRVLAISIGETEAAKRQHGVNSIRRWTPAQRRKAAELWAKRLPAARIAATLSVDFGKPITAEAVKRLAVASRAVGAAEVFAKRRGGSRQEGKP